MKFADDGIVLDSLRDVAESILFQYNDFTNLAV